MKKFAFIFATLFISFSLSTFSFCSESNILNLTKYKDAASLDSHKNKIAKVVLRGKINHFGVNDFHAVVTGVNVWAAEYPDSKQLGIRSDETGWWTMEVIKYKGKDVRLSFVYEKEGWITTKSNVITVRDIDDTDFAIQFIDPKVFNSGMKPLIGIIMMSLKQAPGSDSTFKNAVVATVGKSWASMHDDRLPHGDSGATVTAIPGAFGPIYFDESVKPNPAYKHTSADGGVAWINVPKGDHIVTAFKDGEIFSEVKFVIDDADIKNGVVLYVASPPNSIQSSNDSNP
jgi:hypothetical protein